MIHRLIAFSLFFATLSLNAQTVTWYKQGETGSQQTQQAAYNGPETGFATFYAAYLAGQPTAYGETYQPTEMTASHATLPMGTLLKVTRLDNGSAVTVRVNDRGGLCNGCVIVLSNSAARAINLVQTGRSQVRLEKVGFSNWNPQPPAVSTSTPQVAARTVEDRRASWEEELSRNNAPNPVNDPYAYQPATYNSGTSAAVVPTATVQSAYPQQQVVYTPPAAPTTASRVVRPQQVSTTEGRIFNNTQQQEVAVMSPGSNMTARNPLAAREIQPGSRVVNHSVAQQQEAPVTYSPPVVIPQEQVQYTTYPNTTGALNNRVVVAPASSPASGQPYYAVQVGAYGNRANADRMAANLRSRGLNSVSVKSTNGANGTVINRVVVGQFADANAARLAMTELLETYSLTGVVRTF